jgi:pimeloyl-ACP methyl ester carboxylesterase
MQTNATTPTPRNGYAPVNGLQMYYEIYGTGQPLILIHGAFSAVGTSFGALVPALAQGRQVIGVELQGHGRTADIDRPLTLRGLAGDIAGLLDHLGIARADVFGYSLGSAVALEFALQYPARVRKLIVASLTYTMAGMHPGMMEGMADLQPEHLMGSPWHDEYARLAPRPADFPTLVNKVKQLEGTLQDWPAEAIRSLQPPTLVIIGDSDIVQPEHAVEIFRLLGGGVMGDMVGLPKSQLAILPGTTHATLPSRADLLLPLLTAFLDAPMPAAT